MLASRTLAFRHGCPHDRRDQRAGRYAGLGWVSLAADRRRAVEYAHVVGDLVDLYYPEAGKIVLQNASCGCSRGSASIDAYRPSPV